MSRLRPVAGKAHQPGDNFSMLDLVFKEFWGLVLWHLWIGRAWNPGPGVGHLALEALNVGVWLTRGDLALEASVDFLAVAEHRLIPARGSAEG